MLSLITQLSAWISTRTSVDRERGATAVEYGLLVGLIAVVIIAGVTLLGDNLLAMFNGIAGEVAPPAAP